MKISEYMIGMVVLGGSPTSILEKETGVGVKYQEDMKVRSFLDGYGTLRFSTMDHILIDENSDDRLKYIVEVLDSISPDNPVFDILSSYEGSLGNLHDYILLMKNFVKEQ